MFIISKSMSNTEFYSGAKEGYILSTPEKTSLNLLSLPQHSGIVYIFATGQSRPVYAGPSNMEVDLGLPPNSGL